MQYCYTIKGLIAPIEETIFKNILIKGIYPSDQAKVYFKIQFSNQTEKDKIADSLPKRLEKIAQFYALVTNRHFSISGGHSSTTIDEKRPFGWDKLGEGLTFIPIYSDEDRQKKVPELQITLAKYHELNSILESKKNSYLKNAIDYYYRSLEDGRLEKKLIDLMISLESLFSKETNELSLRYSLRASFFLSSKNINNRLEIYNDIRSLYNNRSKVVHGTGNIKLDYGEIIRFQNYLKEAIKIFLYIGKSKDQLLSLIDHSIVDNGKLEQLNKIINKAIEKW